MTAQRSESAFTELHGACYHTGMALSDPQQRWPARAILVLGFVAIAAVSFAAGWLVGTELTEHIRWI